MSEIKVVILGLAALFFIGHALQWLFVKTKVPDLLLLIIAGFALGPSGLNIIQSQHLGQVGEVLATVTLIIILYEGGLHLSASELLKSSLPALALSLLSFSLIAGAATLILGLASSSFSMALLVGLGIGSTSSAVVFPLVKPLDLKEKTKTLLSLESAFTDVLAIIAFMAVLSGILSQSHSASALILGFGAKPFLSVGLGAGAALIWSSLRKLLPHLFTMPFSTEAWALLTYGLIEIFGLNGPIGILAFGFALANLSLLPQTLSPLFNLKPVTENEMSLLQAISFLLRTFFFLYLGMIMRLAGLSVFLWALGLQALILATRYAAVRLVFSKKRFPCLTRWWLSAWAPGGWPAPCWQRFPLRAAMSMGSLCRM